MICTFGKRSFTQSTVAWMLDALYEREADIDSFVRHGQAAKHAIMEPSGMLEYVELVITSGGPVDSAPRLRHELARPLRDPIVTHRVCRDRAQLSHDPSAVCEGVQEIGSLLEQAAL